MITFDDFEAAKAERDRIANEEIREYVVSGTYKDERPVYFIVPADQPDDEVRDIAFEIREGRKPSSYEYFLLAQAQALRAS